MSSTFLLAIAAINLAIFFGVARTFRRVRAGGAYEEEEHGPAACKERLPRSDLSPAVPHGLAELAHVSARLSVRPGFDTATEIGLIGISAAEASKGLPIWSILVFPALFTAGMTLIDTTDSVLMVGAYGWAFLKPIRKLYYNMTITADLDRRGAGGGRHRDTRTDRQPAQSLGRVLA